MLENPRCKQSVQAAKENFFTRNEKAISKWELKMTRFGWP